MTQDIISQLAPSGVLRAGINMANILLVTDKTAAGEPIGVAPDMARAIADRLGIEVEYVTFASPGEVADGVATDAWDIGLIAADPSRAESINFTLAYVEVEATYLVAEGSSFQSVADVDQPGIRIAVSERSAYDLYLTRALEQAELVRAKGMGGAVELLTSQNLDALAGLRPALNVEMGKLPDTRILEDRYTSIQQAIGAKPGNAAVAEFLATFVAESKANGLIAGLIEKHGVTGKLQVATGA
jgi:polar amino acid transport system substrate-binding protein